MEWWSLFLSRAQAVGFGLTAFGVWMYFLVPDDRWLYIVVLIGFCINTTDGSWSRAVPPLQKAFSKSGGKTRLYWPGYVVFLLAIAFALALRVSRDGLPISSAARFGGILILVSSGLILLRVAVNWFLDRKDATR